jgi:hypothetical protein
MHIPARTRTICYGRKTREHLEGSTLKDTELPERTLENNRLLYVGG